MMIEKYLFIFIKFMVQVQQYVINKNFDVTEFFEEGWNPKSAVKTTLEFQQVRKLKKITKSTFTKVLKLLLLSTKIILSSLQCLFRVHTVTLGIRGLMFLSNIYNSDNVIAGYSLTVGFKGFVYRERVWVGYI